MAADASAIKTQGPDSLTAGNFLPVAPFDNAGPTFSDAVSGAYTSPYAMRIFGVSPAAWTMMPCLGFLFDGSKVNRAYGNSPSTPIATVTGAVATQTSPDQVNYNGKGLLLHVKVANLAGTPTFTPRLQWKDASGGYWTIWSAAAALSANGDKTYQIYPGASDVGSHTEQKQMILPRNFRLQLVYAGNGSSDKADVTADMEIIL